MFKNNQYYIYIITNIQLFFSSRQSFNLYDNDWISTYSKYSFDYIFTYSKFRRVLDEVFIWQKKKVSNTEFMISFSIEDSAIYLVKGKILLELVYVLA